MRTINHLIQGDRMSKLKTALAALTVLGVVGVVAKLIIDFVIED